MGWGVRFTPRPLLPSGKTRYPLYRRLGGPQGWSGQVRKISPSPGIRSLDRPSRSQTLYPATLPGPHYSTIYAYAFPSNFHINIFYKFHFLLSVLHDQPPHDFFLFVNTINLTRRNIITRLVKQFSPLVTFKPMGPKLCQKHPFLRTPSALP
jgi:hypothetical protein